MTAEIDILNIPAFQRKKSIAAKAKTTATPKKNKPQKIERLPRELAKCGTCECYFDNIKVAIIKLTKPLRLGDSLLIENTEGLFRQEVKSMQINRKEVRLATTGSEIGIKVAMEPKLGGQIYKAL